MSVRLPIEAGTATEELWAGSCLSCLGPHFSLRPPSSPAPEPAEVWTLRQDPQHLAPSPAGGFSLVHCLLAPGPLHRGAPETCRQVPNQRPTWRLILEGGLKQPHLLEAFPACSALQAGARSEPPRPQRGLLQQGSGLGALTALI